ncbi:histidine kinase [Caldicellulosiruptor kronotskyensis 2002]|uniref:histidine kinase n=1 Tax=Caldicellulosiruptor kronotskyensis (strain DSM 18902 / VKM B-2412 / 2002) TaxID=632348 RepID=E4SBY8_CALK2|nr:ATP-binding protein [Caldicellulosiruptor kronotskyensis]ADQ46261.1 histidine kinase [Caldicellulosiruptor kronotskyensis 2002]
MNEISLYILDLVQNSIEAGASLVKIEIVEDLKEDLFTITIEDNGRGIPKDVIDKVTDPFYTTRKTRKVGLGLSLAKQVAMDCEGSFEIERLERGTKIVLKLKHSHIDRPPLGNITETLLALISGAPNVDFTFCYRNNQSEFIFDTKSIREILGNDVPLNTLSILDFIRGQLERGLSNLTGGANNK